MKQITKQGPTGTAHRSRRRIALVSVALLFGIIAAGCSAATTSETTTSSPALTETTLTVAPESSVIDNSSEVVTSSEIVETGDTVKVHYVGSLLDGETFDSSRDRGEPLEFVVGDGQLIKGFDQGVLGMTVGETKTLIIAPEDGYGARTEDNVVELPATAAEIADVAVGDTVYVNEGSMAVEVVAIGEDSITVDANHPLAGKTLQFDIEIIEITKGT